MADYPLNPSSKSPLHVQIADYIRRKVYDLEWGAGEAIPSEHELMRLFGVSRGTVQKGIKSLVAEGLLEQTRGKGTFVTQPVLQYTMSNSLLSYAESLRLQNVDFHTDVLESTIMPADHACSQALNVPLNAPVLKLHRLRSTEKEPIILMESRVNLLACPGLDEVDFTKETLFSAMEHASGHKIGYAKVQYGARISGQKRSEILQCHEGAPLLNIHQTVYLQNNVAVEWANMWLPANKYIFTSVLQRV